MCISEKAKERFVRDRKLPLRLYREPYFTSRLKLYDRLFDTQKYWDMFMDELKKYPNEQGYFEEYNRIKDEAINFIKTNSAFQAFNNDKDGFRVENIGFSTNDIYHPSSTEGDFISIDMKKANFSSLRHYDAEIFGGADTWEGFVGKFTDSEYVQNSKYIREVILGNCNPKKHISYEKYLMDQVLTEVLQIVESKRILSFCNDEIIIDISGITEEEKLHKYYEPLTDVVNNAVIPLRIERFYLIAASVLKEEKPFGYIRLLPYNHQIDFKCVNNLMMPFLLKVINGWEISQEDGIFEHEGFLAQRLELPNIVFNFHDMPYNDILDMIRDVAGIVIA